MTMPRAMVVAVIAVACRAAPAMAEKQAEHRLVFGLGGVTPIELAKPLRVAAGATTFVEWNAIDRWLELELGASALAWGAGRVELSATLLFKVPFRLAPGVELMLGLGPQVTHAPGHGTVLGGELALDLMCWPSDRVGFWVEPSFDFEWRGAVASLGVSFGPIVGW